MCVHMRLSACVCMCSLVGGCACVPVCVCFCVCLCVCVCVCVCACVIMHNSSVLVLTHVEAQTARCGRARWPGCARCTHLRILADRQAVHFDHGLLAGSAVGGCLEGPCGACSLLLLVGHTGAGRRDTASTRSCPSRHGQAGHRAARARAAGVADAAWAARAKQAWLKQCWQVLKQALVDRTAASRACESRRR